MPSLNINPTASTASLIGLTQVESKLDDSVIDQPSHSVEENEKNCDLNESGSGIHLPGYSRPNESPKYDGNAFPPQLTNVVTQPQLNQLSNETQQFIKQRNVLEANALEWLEHELMARFISNLASHQQEALVEDEEFIDEEPTAPEIDIVGESVDPDLLQVLIQECLEEKIASMLLLSQQQESQPVASPRKSSNPFEFNRSNQRLSFDFETQQLVATPVITPDEPAISNPFTPRVSVEEKVEPAAPPPPQPPQIIYLPQPNDEESLLEETLVEAGMRK